MLVHHCRALLIGALTGLVLLSPGLAAAAVTAPEPSQPAINVPLFMQQDKLWKTHELGTCPSDTLGNAGCAVISVAMVYAKYGVVLDSSMGRGMNADILNAWLRDNNRFGYDPDGGLCDVEWWRLPPGVQYTGSDLSFVHLNAELAAGRPVIALIHNPLMPMHFVVITGQNGATYDINDPYNLTRRQLDDGTPDAYIVDELHYFRPTPVSATTIAYRANVAALWAQVNPIAGSNVQTGINTLLSDGRVLLLNSGVAGDGTSPAKPPTAQIYNPASDTFTPTGSMLEPGMTNPTGILLPDGRVFFSGDGAAPEIYNPVSGTFARTAKMICARCVGRTATLLADGRVLLAGGYDPISEDAAPNEIYDPADGQFVYTGAMMNGRTLAGTLVLPDGRILFVGGLALGSAEVDNSPSPALTAEIYDPATWLFTSIGDLPTGLISPNLSLRPDGRVLISGGYDLTGQPASGWTYFDPATGELGNPPVAAPYVY
jgi:hypothetical protein